MSVMTNYYQVESCATPQPQAQMMYAVIAVAPCLSVSYFIDLPRPRAQTDLWLCIICKYLKLVKDCLNLGLWEGGCDGWWVRGR